MLPKIDFEKGKCFICGEMCNQHNFLCDYCDEQADKASNSCFYFDKYDITNKFFSIIEILTYTELIKSCEDRVRAIYMLTGLAIEQYDLYNDLYLFTKIYYIKELINEQIINYILSHNTAEQGNHNKNKFDLMQDIENYNANIHNNEKPNNFRKNNPNDFICNDGHNVRSLSELVIDNVLYDNNIRHIYEKSIYTINGKIWTSDFFLPDYDIYIEFWGMMSNYEYKRNRELKLEDYNKLNLKVIEIFPEHLKSLNDYLLLEINKKANIEK